MADPHKKSCALCMFLPLVLGLGALLFAYYTFRDSIGNDIQNDLAYKSSELLKAQQIGNVTVNMDGRDAHLSGTVANQERSSEIENIVAAMPGIRVVDNQLTIAKVVEPVTAPVVKEEVIAKPKLEPLPESEPEVALAPEPIEEDKVEELLQTLDLSGITFLFGKDQISEEGKSILDEVISILHEHTNFDVAIEGHTDSVGNDELNFQLSQSRAQSVLGYLTANGIQTERLSAIGYGEANPVADNSTSEGRALNRRIEFKVTRQ